MSEIFVPKQIGLQNTELREKIEFLYQSLVSDLDYLRANLTPLLNLGLCNREMILTVIKKNKSDLNSFLKREFIRANNISYPGLNVEKLISQDLIELPVEYNEIIETHEEIQKILGDIEKTNFKFPLEKVFGSDTPDWWELSPDFHNELLKFTASFTESEKQNEVLEAIQKYCDLIIEMQNLGIISKSKGAWQAASQIMDMAIDEDIRKEPSLIPYRHMFNKCRELKKFKADIQSINKTFGLDTSEFE